MTEIDINKINFKKSKGLVPVVSQDFKSKKVLMLAYMNKESLKKTLETGYAHYWSRSRKKIWMKGETSGCVQKIKDISIDCDEDSLLLLVYQKGPACHSGNTTCFYRKIKH
jgi:phosphoribosyl-AMP cyclohydrolase